MVLRISFMRGLWARGIFACAGLGEVVIVFSLWRGWFAPASAAEYFRATKSLLPCLLALAIALLVAQIIGIAVRDMFKKPSMDFKDILGLIMLALWGGLPLMGILSLVRLMGDYGDSSIYLPLLGGYYIFLIIEGIRNGYLAADAQDQRLAVLLGGISLLVLVLLIIPGMSMQLPFPPGTLPAEQPHGWTKAKELDLGLTLAETHGLGIIYFAILAIIRQVWVVRRIHAMLMRNGKYRPQKQRPVN